MRNYDKGDLVRCTGLFTDDDGVAQDPSEVYFKVKDPAGETTTYQYGVDGDLKKSATGSYYIDIDADTSGIWSYRFYSTGSGQAADEEKFTVRRSEF
jgi:hypothetical protein